jgi:hypothetical protein
MRRAIALLCVALGVIYLSAHDIVPWRISLLAGLIMGMMLLGWKRRGKKGLSPIAETFPPELPLGTHAPAEPIITETTITEHAFIDEDPTAEMEPIEPSKPPPPIPKIVKDAHAPLYDHHFHWMWVVERVAPLAYLFGLLVSIQAVSAFLLQKLEVTKAGPYLARVHIPGGSLLWVVVLDLLVVVVLALRTVYLKQIWNTLRFVVTSESYSMPRTMPGPLTDRTPTIRTIDVVYMIERNWLDKFLGTCRLTCGDKPGKVDDAFQVVKWLKYPDELRKATGSPPVTKARWFRGKQR